MPPIRVQPVTQNFLTRALDRTPLADTRDCDGDPYAYLAGKKPGEGLQCWFLLECRDGHAYKIFKLCCLVQPVIPWRNLPAAMIACNRYNETYRFGKLYCEPADEPQAGVSLRFEGQLDVSDGISEAFLATFINSHLASVCDFLSKDCGDDELFASLPAKPRRKRSSADGKKQGRRRRPSTERRDVEHTIE
jgi:hypothetical protein